MEIDEFMKEIEKKNEKLAKENLTLKSQLRIIEFMAKGLVHEDLLKRIGEIKDGKLFKE